MADKRPYIAQAHGKRADLNPIHEPFPCVPSAFKFKRNHPTEIPHLTFGEFMLLVRTVKDGGEGYHISGDFDRTVPKLYRLVTEALEG